jgi:hypothetical protein
MGSSDGTYLYFMIYGIADHQIKDHGDGTFDIYNWGATGGAADGLIHIDWYRSNVNLLSLTSNMNANPGDRTGFGSYSLFAGMGPAYLQTVLAPGKSSFDPLATLVQNATATNNPADGTGSFFADVVGGTAQSQWDLNGQTNGHDFNGNYTLSPNGDSAGTGVCTDAQLAAGVCFNGFINDPIKARKIPEPGSLALLGLGFAGLAGLRRRRNA